MFWLGNSAKAQIIADVIAQAQGASESGIRVLDLGCGDGGAWPAVLNHCGAIELIGYDPDSRMAKRAADRLASHRATIYTGVEPPTIDPLADIIVSFSVFEHVWDRRTYLENAKQLLAQGGRCYLNYDDGHFRNNLPLDMPQRWVLSIKGQALTLLAPVMAALKRYDKYRARVSRQEVDRLVRDSGFEIERSFYSNLENFKGLAKTLPDRKRVEFMKFWVEVEDVLNERFSVDSQREHRGDHNNLWAIMPSRTLVLSHSRTEA